MNLNTREQEHRLGARLGRAIGTIRSASEAIQWTALSVALVVGLLVALLSSGSNPFIGPIVIGVIGTLCCAGLFLGYRWNRIASRLEAFEHGVRLTLRGEVHQIQFDELTQFEIHRRHRQYDGSYAGSFAKFIFTIGNESKQVTCELPYHESATSVRVVNHVARGSITALADRLATQLEREGELCWAENIFLTMDSIRVQGARPSDSRHIPLLDIKRCSGSEHEIKMWDEDQPAPVLVIPAGEPNFQAITHLFSMLYSAYEQYELGDVDPVPVTSETQRSVSQVGL